MPTTVSRFRLLVSGCVALGLCISASAASAQDAKSRAAAKSLGETLDQLKLDSIAAPDPADKESFVAALYFQGAQLLVVSAKYSVPALLNAKLEKKDYRDVYIDLNAASVAGSKIFVMDQGADGLVARPGDNAADSWEQADKAVAFDGDWRRSKMSEEEYLKTFAAADERYTRILEILNQQAQAKKGS